MDNKKIAFLNSGNKLFQNSKQGISLFLCSNIFYFIGVAYGFLLKNYITTLLSAMMCVLFAITSLIILLCITKKYIRAIIFAETIMFVELYVNTVLFGLILCYMLTYKPLHIILIFPSIFAFLVYLFVIRRWFKIEDNSKETTSPPKTIRLFAMLGGIFGYFIARTVLTDINNQLALNVALICLVMLSCIFSVAICKNIIKLKIIKNNNKIH